jgi:hypothetical protein
MELACYHKHGLAGRDNQVIVDAHRDDGKRYVVHAGEKVTAFVELESVIRCNISLRETQ